MHSRFCSNGIHGNHLSPLQTHRHRIEHHRLQKPGCVRGFSSRSSVGTSVHSEPLDSSLAFTTHTRPQSRIHSAVPQSCAHCSRGRQHFPALLVEPPKPCQHCNHQNRQTDLPQDSTTARRIAFERHPVPVARRLWLETVCSLGKLF